MRILRDRTSSNELDHLFVMECLKEWKNPQAKLSRLLKQGALIRVKKELYVFGPNFRRHPLSLPLVANKILGPSYVSLEWALNYYGLIPEYVSQVTSVTPGKSRIYETPVGTYSYSHVRLAAYPTGILWIEQPGGEHALIASKEKALVDFLVLRRGRVRTKREIEEILFEDMRIEEEDLESIILSEVENIHTACPHSASKFLMLLLKDIGI